MTPYTQWAVFKGNQFSGVIETNYQWAIHYWATRPGYHLVGGYGFVWCYPGYKWSI